MQADVPCLVQINEEKHNDNNKFNQNVEKIENKPEQVKKEIILSESEEKLKYDSFMTIRFALMIFGMLFLSLNTIYGFALPHGNVECLLDKSFEATAGINKYLHDHVMPRHILIATSSIFVDGLILYMSFYWCLYGKSWRMIVSLAFFYSFRGSLQVN